MTAMGSAGRNTKWTNVKTGKQAGPPVAALLDYFKSQGARQTSLSGAKAPAPPPSKEALLTQQTGESTAYRKRRLAYGRKSTLG